MIESIPFSLAIFKKQLGSSLALVWALASCLQGHETFLRPQDHFMEPGETAKLYLLTGTFDRSVYGMSANAIRRIQFQTKDGINEWSKDSWETVGKDSRLWKGWQRLAAKLGGMDLRDTSAFAFKAGKAGSYLVTLDQSELRVALEEDQYGDYLRSEVRLKEETINEKFGDFSGIITEGFTKHAKTYLQVGDLLTNNVTQAVGQTAEIIPLTHPGKLKSGDTLDLKVLYFNHPAAHQPVKAGREAGAFKKTEDTEVILTSDAQGIVHLPISAKGIWWVSTICLEPAKKSEELDVASHWASFTFEVD